MADEITQCNKILKEDGSVHRYDFSYRIEHNNASNFFCVTVFASELTQPSSESEARTKANTKASAIKSQWVTQETLTSTDASFLTGNVIL